MQVSIQFDPLDPADAARAATWLRDVSGALAHGGASQLPIFDPAALALGAIPDVTPDPATVGFGAGVPSPGVGTAPAPPATAPEGHTFDPSKIPVDADGLPWDNRIHATSTDGAHKKNADGRWKKKRNVDDGEFARIAAELKSIMQLPAPPFAGISAQAGPDPAAVNTTQAPPPPPAPEPAAVAPPPPPPPAAGTGTPTTFTELMQWMGPRITSGKLNAPVIAQTMTAIGVVDGTGAGQVTLLLQRPDLVPSAYAMLLAVAGS